MSTLVSALQLILCAPPEVRHAKLTGWNLVVCGTEQHPYRPLSAAAAKPATHVDRSHSNDAESSYSAYPPSVAQRPPAADFRAAYVGPCQRPTTRYGGGALRKNGDGGGKTAAVQACHVAVLVVRWRGNSCLVVSVLCTPHNVNAVRSVRHLA